MNRREFLAVAGISILTGCESSSNRSIEPEGDERPLHVVCQGGPDSSRLCNVTQRSRSPLPWGRPDGDRGMRIVRELPEWTETLPAYASKFVRETDYEEGGLLAIFLRNDAPPRAVCVAGITAFGKTIRATLAMDSGIDGEPRTKLWFVRTESIAPFHTGTRVTIQNY